MIKDALRFAELVARRALGPHDPVHLVPLCWPALDGSCGCGRGHGERDVGKAPLLGAGYQRLRPTVAEVLEWWRRWPNANWGMLLEPWELVVLDLDGPEAVDEAESLGLPPTLAVVRGGRQHRYFRRPPDVPAHRCTKQGRSRAIDVLAKGYTVIPPSRHRSGDVYTAVDPRPPSEPPDWVIKWLLEAGRSGPPEEACPVRLPPVRLRLSPRLQAVLTRGRDADPSRYPSRSEALYAVITAAVAAGHTDAEILAALLAQPWVREMRRDPGRWLPPQIAKARRDVRVRFRDPRAPYLNGSTLRVEVGL